MEPALSEATAGAQFGRQTIVANILTLFSGSVLSQGMTLVVQFVTARELGANLYGQYAACFVLATLSSIVFNLGLDIWLLKEGGRHPESLDEYLGSVLLIKVILGGLWYLGISIVAPYLNGALNVDSFPPDLVRLSAVWVWFDGGLATLLTAYKALLKNRTTSVLQSASRAIWLIGTLALVGLGISRVSSYLWVRTIAAVISFAVALALASRSFGYRPRIGILRRIIREALPFAASEFLAWASMRLDTLIIALMLGQQEVGLYSPAVGVVNGLFLVPATVYAVIVPVLSNLFHSNPPQFWLTARRTLALLAIIGIGMALAAYLGAGLVTNLLGSSYASAYGLLRILSIILFLHALTYGMAAILVATDRQVQRVNVQVMTVVLNALLNIGVVTIAGIAGVAWVYVITEGVLLIGYSYVVRRQYVRLRTDDTVPEVMG